MVKNHKASKIVFAAVAGWVATNEFRVVSAATYTWSATAGSNLLATQTNYTPTATFATTPAAGDTLVFSGPSTYTTLFATYGTGTPPTFLYGGGGGPNVAFNFSGNTSYTIGLTSDIDNTGNGFTNVNVSSLTTAASETFNPEISGYARTSLAQVNVSNSSALTQLILNGGFQNQSTAAAGVITWQLQFGGAFGLPASIVENGVIADGTGGLTAVEAKYSTVTALNAANTYSGYSFVQPGNGAGFILGNKSALGTGTLVLSANSPISSNTDLSGTNALANSVDLFATATELFSGSNNITFGGTVDLSAALAATLFNTGTATPAGSTVTVNVTNTAATTFAGPIINSGNSTNFAKTGAGILVLGGSSSYSGTTTIGQGNLSLQNTSGSATSGGAVALTGGAATPSIISGTGKSSGLLTVTAGGRIAPGVNNSGTNNDFGVAGPLSLGTVGGMTLTSANVDFDLSATTTGSNDEILTGGTLTLSSVAFTFNETGASLQTGVPYTLISGYTNPLTTFSGLTATEIGTAYTATFTQNTPGGVNELDVTFSAAPEPASLSLVGMAGLMLVRRRRRMIPA